MNELVENQALKYACTYCVAGPGVWCRTNSGAKATALHYDRTDPIRLAWVDGWEEGKKDERDLLQRRQQTYTYNSGHTASTAS